MNKRLIKSETVRHEVHNYYTEEFSPSEIEITFYNGKGENLKAGEESKVYSYRANVPGIDSNTIRKISFPELDYSKNDIAKVLVEYVEYK